MPDVSIRASDLAARLQSASTALVTDVRALAADLLAWKPAPDVWSVMEILCHVAEFIPYWTGQALQIARRPDDPWGRTHTDLARLDAVARAGTRPFDDVVQDIERATAASAAAIRGLSDDQLDAEAVSRNPRWGAKPASFVIEELLVQHVEKHIGQVRRNAAQFIASIQSE